MHGASLIRCKGSANHGGARATDVRSRCRTEALQAPQQNQILSLSCLDINEKQHVAIFFHTPFDCRLAAFVLSVRNRSFSWLQITGFGSVAS
ncbi:hypothetical protein ACLOJK_002457 [Asimina triloba]